MKSHMRTKLLFLASVLITAFLASAATMLVIRSNRDVVIISTEEYKQLKHMLVLSEMAGRVQSDFYGEVPSTEALVNAAAGGMMTALNDPYARYYSKEEYEAYINSLSGEFVGAGLLVSQPDEKGARILEVYEESPAERSGIRKGDIITAIDGTSTANMSLERIAEAMSGEEGDVVKLTISRDGTLMEFGVKLAVVNVKRVTSKLLSGYTGYIRIDMFTGNCAEEFSRAVRDLTGRGMRSLVIDLRDNPGGTLDDVIRIADEVLGECEIVSIKGRSDMAEVFRSDPRQIGVPLAILVNSNSASASEILAGAVQDNAAGIVIGTPTYGKGVVQTTSKLTSNQGWIKFTTAAYYTPGGRNIDGSGIIPDIIVELSDEFERMPLSELKVSEDAQLKAAIEYLSSKSS